VVITFGLASIIGLCLLPFTCGFAIAVTVIRLARRASLIAFGKGQAQRGVATTPVRQSLVLQSDIFHRAG
jgi:hypothetical protein